MRHERHCASRLAIMALCLVVVGCAPRPSAPRDASIDALDASLAPDVETAPALFDPCDVDRPCAPGAQCLQAVDGYPGALCSRACTRSAQCGALGVCAPGPRGSSWCLPACSAGVSCPARWLCFVDAWHALQYCRPFCDETQCGDVGCDLATGFCGTTDDSLADTGGACLRDVECRSGRCSFMGRTPTADSPTGQCFGYCVTLPASAYLGTDLPRGNCPDSSVCAPGGDGYQADLGVCSLACRADADCPPANQCVHSVAGAPPDARFANGYCALWNCNDGTHGCPAGMRCVTTRRDAMGRPSDGRCVVDGADAGSDAAAGD